ncbi:MAG: metallophosphoesterase, partial [Bacteroidales bacterium]
MADNRPIFVISDLHMGDGGPRDNFALGDREKQLGLFLDYVTQERGELIVLGDLFEFWQMNPSKIVTKHKLLLDRLAAMNAIYVVGNHDVDFDHFIGTGFLSHPLFKKMSRPFEREIGGKRFKFMHGHEVDSFNLGDTPGKGRVCCILAGMGEDKNGSPVLPNGEFVEDHLEEIGDILE